MSEQKASGEKFLPVFFVDEVKIDAEFHKDEWPLHITLFPPLETTYTDIAGTAIRSFVNPIEPFDAVVGENDTFGTQEMIESGNGVPVRRIEENTRLYAVHRGLVQALAHLPHSAQFRTPYTPHISIPEHDPRATKGESLRVEGMSIAIRQPGSATWRVVDKMRFKGENS